MAPRRVPGKMVVICRSCKTTRQEPLIRPFNPQMVPPCRNCGSLMSRVATARPGERLDRKKTKPKGKTVRQYVDYGKYIHSQDWKRKRAKAIRHYHGLCSVCGSRNGIQVHHRTYKRLGHELMRDLRLLCADCHGIRHEDKYLPQDALSKEFRDIIGPPGAVT